MARVFLKAAMMWPKVSISRLLSNFIEFSCVLRYISISVLYNKWNRTLNKFWTLTNNKLGKMSIKILFMISIGDNMFEHLVITIFMYRHWIREPLIKYFYSKHNWSMNIHILLLDYSYTCTCMYIIISSLSVHKIYALINSVPLFIELTSILFEFRNSKSS